MTRCAGIAHCRGEWIAGVADSSATHSLKWFKIPDLLSLPHDLEEWDVEFAGLVSPIGLVEQGTRPVDTEARKMLGAKRASSVFPVPTRPILAARSREEACELCESLEGKRVTRQSFSLFRGIRETESWITPIFQERIVEVHPEVAFCQWSGIPMRSPARDLDGRLSRLSILQNAFPEWDQSEADDWLASESIPRLNSLVALRAASRMAEGDSERIGGHLDPRGLRMEMAY